MSFTRQDAITFAIGLAAAVVLVAAEALIRFETEGIEDPLRWGISLGTGILAAAGRYIVTEMTQRGFGGN